MGSFSAFGTHSQLCRENVLLYQALSACLMPHWGRTLQPLLMQKPPSPGMQDCWPPCRWERSKLVMVLPKAFPCQICCTAKTFRKHFVNPSTKGPARAGRGWAWHFRLLGLVYKAQLVHMHRSSDTRTAKRPPLHRCVSRKIRSFHTHQQALHFHVCDVSLQPWDPAQTEHKCYVSLPLQQLKPCV